MTASTASHGLTLTRPGWVGAALDWARAHATTFAWLLPVLAIGAAVKLVGIGGSPQRIDDEGTYVAQAWAMLNYGELAHYTYWYDHPPLGWLQLAGYAGLTGAFARWDISVLAGREAVIVATLAAGVLLWMLARRLRVSRPAAAGAVLLFLLSPLAVQFHRTVYLDNIATPWLLLAFVLALSRGAQLAAFAGSAAAFAIAVLTKETYLLALPVLIWVMLRSAHRETRRYTLSLAASVLVLIGGSYVLLALVKGELLPGAGRVSLLDGILFQLSARDGSGSPLDPESLMSATLGMWWQLDPVFIVAGIAAGVAGLFLRRMRPFAVLLLGLTAFMFRPGGYLPVPYVIALLPFAALLIAAAADRAVRPLGRRSGAGAVRRTASVAAVVAVGAGAVIATPLWAAQLRGFVLADLDAPMRDAQSWLAANVERNQRLVVDDAMWVDLVRAGWDRDEVVWYYKVDTDPAVQAQSPNGWQDTDYVITTDSMRTFPSGFPQVQNAIDNSVVVASFGEASTQVDVRRVVPQGIESAQTSLTAAADERVLLGTQIAANPAITVDDEARGLLLDGLIDSRIAGLLGGLASAGDMTIDGFPAIAGEDDQPRRQIALTTLAGAPAIEGGQLTDAARSVTDALGGPYAPGDVRIDGDRLLLTYDQALDPRLQ